MSWSKDPQLVNTYRSIAEIEHALGHYQSSVQYIKEALSLHEEKIGKKNED